MPEKSCGSPHKLDLKAVTPASESSFYPKIKNNNNRLIDQDDRTPIQ